jgi:hypothetical protein
MHIRQVCTAELIHEDVAALCWSADSKDAVLDAARQSTALSNKETRGHPAVALVSGFKSWRGTEVLVIPVGVSGVTI